MAHSKHSGHTRRHVHRNLHLVSPQLHGADIHALQFQLNRELGHRKLPWREVKADGDYGPRTRDAAHMVAWLIGLSGHDLRAIHHGLLTKDVQHLLRNPEHRSPVDRLRDRHRRNAAQKLRHEHDTGPEAAVSWLEEQARKGVHEIGESNTGPVVDEVEAYFGLHGEPWCGCAAGYAAEKIGGTRVKIWYPSGNSLIEQAHAGVSGARVVSFDQIMRGMVLVLWGGEHVVTARANPKGDSIDTVEGNTSPNNSDSQADGGCFATKTRSRSDVTCAIRIYG